MMTFFFLLVVVALLIVNCSGGEWVELRRRNTKATSPLFAGSEMDIDAIFFSPNAGDNASTSTSDQKLYYYGGSLLSPVRLENEVDQLRELALRALEHLLASIFDTKHDLYSSQADCRFYYNHATADMVHAMEVEVGLYDHASKRILMREWQPVLLGHVAALQFQVDEQHHKVLLHFDQRNRSSLGMHTWSSISEERAEEEVEQHKAQLKVVSYNMWHNMPPSYLHPQVEKRWAKYKQRMEHLADVIMEEQADVVLLQEVRLDNAFRGPFPTDSGGQIQFLASLLGGKWQIIFQPAMSMQSKDGNNLGLRQEEGVAILSKRPLHNAFALLLPRSLIDRQDDHTRVVLMAQIPLQRGGERTLHVMTTHLSLSEAARQASITFLLEYLTKRDMANASQRMIILGGDLNAEPHEVSTQLLASQFHDTSSAKEGEGFTFPACKPVKRIDYLFVSKQHSHQAGQAYTIGEKAKGEDIRVEPPEGIGMLDDESPIYASDHFGVAMSVLMHPRERIDNNDEL